MLAEDEKRMHYVDMILRSKPLRLSLVFLKQVAFRCKLTTFAQLPSKRVCRNERATILRRMTASFQPRAPFKATGATG